MVQRYVRSRGLERIKECNMRRQKEVRKNERKRGEEERRRREEEGSGERWAKRESKRGLRDSQRGRVEEKREIEGWGLGRRSLNQLKRKEERKSGEDVESRSWEKLRCAGRDPWRRERIERGRSRRRVEGEREGTKKRENKKERREIVRRKGGRRKW